MEVGERPSQSSTAGAMPAGRDLRLDLFRGLALWFIFLNHIPGNIASWLTVRNYGFSDATEIFVFISGYTAALVYSDAMRKNGLIQSGARIVKRAWQIYVAHVFLFVIYAATIAYAAGVTGNPSHIDGFGLTELYRQPDSMILQVLLLRFKLFNMDVLPIYIAVLVAFPPMLWVLVRKPGLALAVSVALYVLARSNGWNLVSHAGDPWVFNPFAWQLLFVFGAWCALGGARRLAGLIRSRTVGLTAGGYLAFAFAIVVTWHVPALAEFVPALAVASDLPNRQTQSGHTAHRSFPGADRADGSLAGARLGGSRIPTAAPGGAMRYALVGNHLRRRACVLCGPCGTGTDIRGGRRPGRR